MNIAKLLTLATCVAAASALLGCGAPTGMPAEKLVRDIDAYYGSTVTVRAKVRSGARCSVGDDEGKFRTYCKGDTCQYCKGPLVFDLGSKVESAEDWPMILGGTHEYKDIRCKGPINKIECHPFEPGKTYVIRGVIERHKPPKLLVSKFWKVE